MSLILPLLIAMVVTGGSDCPAAHPDAEPRVRTLLTGPFLPQLRAQFDLGSATAAHIEPLTDDRDAATCRALWQAVRTSGTNLSTADHVSFYRSGDRYFVPIRRERPHAPGVVIRLDGPSSVDVYDAEFQLVGRFAA